MALGTDLPDFSGPAARATPSKPDQRNRLLRLVLMGVGVGIVVGLNVGFVGLFRTHRTAVYVTVGVIVFVFVFAIELRRNMKTAQKPPG